MFVASFGRWLDRTHRHIGPLLTISLVLTTLAIRAQDGQSGMIQPRRLVDAHTAGVLPKASFDIEARIYPNGSPTMSGGGLQCAVSVGLLDRLNVGISYGADGLVGRGRHIRPNPYPGAFIKYRVFEEDYFVPGVAIGYDHQGYGGIEDHDYNGFVYKSPGFFIALSKNYLLFTKLQLGLHGVASFSLEEIERVRWPTAGIGLDLGVNEELAWMIEYDAGLNARDRTGYYLNPFYGCLNTGIRWAVTPHFHVEFDAKDLLENKLSGGRRLGWSREFKFVYVDQF